MHTQYLLSKIDTAVGCLLDAVAALWRDDKQIFARVEGKRMLETLSDLTDWSLEEVMSVLEFTSHASEQDITLD
jgi:hypothetical protein